MADYLGTKTCSQEKLTDEIKKVFVFINQNSDQIGNGTDL